MMAGVPSPDVAATPLSDMHSQLRIAGQAGAGVQTSGLLARLDAPPRAPAAFLLRAPRAQLG